MFTERKITYSPAYTLVMTHECFNRCSYCNFREEIGRDSWLTLDEAKILLDRLAVSETAEILILSGEVHPNSARRREWFQRVRDICELALSLGFLPHTNVGPLCWEEIKSLREVNVSMGLMLEQLTPNLLKSVHKYAPSKRPEIRLEQIEWAGKLRIPFTTGLLLGIGETETDRWESLKAIAQIQQRWGHIQEVILQPHSPGTRQSYKDESFSLDRLPLLIRQAREILPETVAIQIPPNLIIKPQLLIACIEAGARDLGGISPKDEVNPNYPHLTANSLQAVLEAEGWELIPRLPIYPHHYGWLSPKLQKNVKAKENELKKPLRQANTLRLKEKQI